MKRCIPGKPFRKKFIILSTPGAYHLYVSAIALWLLISIIFIGSVLFYFYPLYVSIEFWGIWPDVSSEVWNAFDVGWIINWFLPIFKHPVEFLLISTKGMVLFYSVLTLFVATVISLRVLVLFISVYLVGLLLLFFYCHVQFVLYLL